MARPKVDPALVARALELVKAGKTAVEAAESVGISKTVVYAALHDAAMTRFLPAPVAPPPALADAVAAAADAMDTALAPHGQQIDRPALVQVTVPASPPATSPLEEAELAAALGSEDLHVLDRMIIKLEATINDDQVSETRLGSLCNTLASLIAKRAKLRPPSAPTADELERRARPDADEVLRLIEESIRKREERAEKDGVCLWCGASVRKATA